MSYNGAMYILVLFASNHGGTAQVAQKISLGIEMEGVEARVRTVSKKASEYVAVEINDLKNCSGLAMGSPSNFGSINSELKNFLEGTTGLWFNGDLSSKPAMLFGTSSTIHGGQESLLLSMMIPLLHHGMIIAGTPYTIPELQTTITGGTPYGPTAVLNQEKKKIDKDESAIAKKSGQRLAQLTKKLSQS